MNPFKVTIIPPTIPRPPDRSEGIPGKERVVGYAQVLKGTGAGVQIRKNIRRLIVNYPNWELTYVKTDYCQTPNQESTFRSLLSLLHAIKFRYLDILIIHSANDLENALSLADLLLEYCKFFGVILYIAHNDLLLSECDFIL